MSLLSLQSLQKKAHFLEKWDLLPQLHQFAEVVWYSLYNEVPIDTWKHRVCVSQYCKTLQTSFEALEALEARSGVILQ